MEPRRALHLPVMVEEVAGLMAPSPGDIFVDATFGAGGHSSALLKALAPGGKILGIDRDPNILEVAKSVFQTDIGAGRLVLVNAPFSSIADVLEEQHQPRVSGILADLGVSSFQLEDAARGFSFMRDGPLDMRMDPKISENAADLVNDLSETELADLIYNYGEDRASRRIAKALVSFRKKSKITTTGQLCAAIESVMPRREKIHPATRTFQALRIAVNRELEELEGLLDQALDCLEPGGRLAIISFHSLEDRIIKHRFRAWKADKKGELLSRKPKRAEQEERKNNPRSRSAKLRGFRKAQTFQENDGEN